MKEKIINTLKSLGITEVGFVRAGVFSQRYDIMQKKVPFVSSNAEERINPFLIMEDAKTIIVYLIPYKTDDKRSNLSSYAKGEDYHIVAKRISDMIADELLAGGYKAVSYCDNGVLDDRYLAYLAGLGFYGRNGLLINDTYGTYTFIGYIITDCEFEENKPIDKMCMDCGLCSKNCPGGAIGKDGIDFNRCASYLTQKKGELTNEETEIIKKSGYVWGCDICQDVCPHNASAKSSPIDAFSHENIEKLSIGELSNKEFLHKYKNRAFTWRGAGIIRRNIAIMEK